MPSVEEMALNAMPGMGALCEKCQWESTSDGYPPDSSAYAHVIGEEKGALFGVAGIWYPLCLSQDDWTATDLKPDCPCQLPAAVFEAAIKSLQRNIPDTWFVVRVEGRVSVDGAGDKYQYPPDIGMYRMQIHRAGYWAGIRHATEDDPRLGESYTYRPTFFTGLALLPDIASNTVQILYQGGDKYAALKIWAENSLKRELERVQARYEAIASYWRMHYDASAVCQRERELDEMLGAPR